MHIVFLKLSTHQSLASRFLEGHKTWLQRGFDDGVFLLAGSLESDLGGGLLAQGLSRAELEKRLQADPFVAEDVVRPEIFELDPSRADARLKFLVS